MPPTDLEEDTMKVAQELAESIRMVCKKNGNIKNNVGFCDIRRVFIDAPKDIWQKKNEGSMRNNDVIPTSTNPTAPRVVKSTRQVHCRTTQKNTPKSVPINSNGNYQPLFRYEVPTPKQVKSVPTKKHTRRL